MNVRIIHRDRERIVDSSGTEGDSSNSQRSVVYLHATTVGAIPQPHVLHTRRTKSREELSSLKSSSIAAPPSSSIQSTRKPQKQPMTRTVSRSLSVLAPWTPKHIHEGYEINYSQVKYTSPFYRLFPDIHSCSSNKRKPLVPRTTTAPRQQSTIDRCQHPHRQPTNTRSLRTHCQDVTANGTRCRDDKNHKHQLRALQAPHSYYAH